VGAIAHPPRGFSSLQFSTKMFFDRLSHSPLFRGRSENLHTARFAYPYELQPLIGQGLADEASLLLGVLDPKTILRVTAQPGRPELNNLAVIARTRGGKGLLAKAQILTWTGSLIVNDIKGELFDATAGEKARTSDVYVIDTRGVGHRYDPLSGRLTPGELRGIAKYLLLEPDEGNGRVFTKRAINMLTALFQAARMEGVNPLVYAGHFLHCGMREAARRLEELSRRAGLSAKDNLATRFLSDPYAEADFDSRFLGDAWSTLTSKLEDIVEENALACVAGSDFSAKDILCGKRPVTVYLRWPERHLDAYTPLIRLIWSSLIDDMCSIYDERRGKGCRPVLLLLDEAARAPIAGLPEYAATVAGRRISLWMSFQSRAQPAAIYGEGRANILWDNMDSFIYYRPPTGNKETAAYIEDLLGEISRFAHSETAHHGQETAEGKTEKGVPLLSAWEIRRMKDQDVVIFHREVPPFRAQRLDWRNFPSLVARTKQPAPTLLSLPDIPDISPMTSPEEALPGRFSPGLD